MLYIHILKHFLESNLRFLIRMSLMFGYKSSLNNEVSIKLFVPQNTKVSHLRNPDFYSINQSITINQSENDKVETISRGDNDFSGS